MRRITTNVFHVLFMRLTDATSSAQCDVVVRLLHMYYNRAMSFAWWAMLEFTSGDTRCYVPAMTLLQRCI